MRDKETDRCGGGERWADRERQREWKKEKETVVKRVSHIEGYREREIGGGRRREIERFRERQIQRGRDGEWERESTQK